MSLALDLRKEKVLDLKKKLNILDQKAQVVLCLDYSGSMSQLYKNGSVQDLVERILPLGLAFDDNGEVDCYLFDGGVRKLPNNITSANLTGYVQKEIHGHMGGTNYTPVISAVIEDFAEIASSRTEKKSGGIFGFGSSETVINTYKKLDLPVFVIFITDGDNADHGATVETMRDASNAGVFFQFVGIGDAEFNFLKKLDTLSGRTVDNANFFTVQDLAKKTDDELYALLLNEFPSFVKDARSKGLIA